MLIKKYFKRPQNPKGMRLQPYDFRMLALLDEYRFLDSYLLWKLTNLYHPEFTWERARHRISLAWSNGFLDRPVEQLAWLVKQDRYHLIHCLTKEGARLVSEQYGRDFEQTTWRVNQERTNFRYLEHQLAISQFRAAIQLSQAFEIPLWLHDRQLTKEIQYQVQTEQQQHLTGAARIGQTIKARVQPDSFFAFKDSGVTQFAALEIDRGTTSIKTMSRKYLAYYKLLKYLDSQPISIHGHKVRHFWILTVCPDESHFENPGTRVSHLQESIRTLSTGDKGPSIAGHRSFLFATEDQISWERPESVTERIWQTPNIGESYSLLDLASHVDTNRT